MLVEAMGGEIGGHGSSHGLPLGQNQQPLRLVK
jgi:hypothetical protein